VESIIQALKDLIQAEGPQPDGCQLDRQRNAVEAANELRGGGRVRRRQLECCAGFSGAPDEQRDGLGLCERRGSVVVRHGQRTNVDDGLARDAERLPARRKDPEPGRLAQHRVCQHGRGVEKVLAVVKDEKQTLGRQEVDEPGYGPLARLVAQPERRHDRLRDELGLPQAGQLHEPHAIWDAPVQVGR
jgi:hypothetical protein